MTQMQKKVLWWLLPAILAVILVGALLIADSSAGTPFLYTAF